MIINTDKNGKFANTFKINNNGVLAEFDMIMSLTSTAMAGFLLYVKLNKSSISQGSGLYKSEVNSWDLGLLHGVDGIC